MSENTHLFGGWSPYHKLDSEDKTVFDEALAGFVGVDYQPFSVSTQLVAGKNYRFKCHATLPGPIRLEWEAIVEIFQPLDGKPFITGIHRI